MRFRLTTRSLSFRLTLWYAAIFLISTAALFGVAYTLIASHFKKEDRTVLQARASTYIAAYQSEELDGLENRLNAEREPGKPFPYLVRIATPQGITLFLNAPDRWAAASADLEATSGHALREGFHALPVNLNQEERVYEVGVFRLKDGNFLQVGINVTQRENLLDQLRRVFYVAIILTVAASFGLGYFLAYRALKPVRSLAAAIESITQTGDLDTRVPVGASRDELNELARLFNAMQERIARLVQGMRESLDNIAHDLRTPLTRLRASAETALISDDGEQRYREALSDCLEEAERMAGTLNALLDISEADAGMLKIRHEDILLKPLVDACADLYQHVAEDKHISLRINVPDDLRLVSDSGKLQQIISNLLDNAVKYTPENRRIDIEARRTGEDVVIAVTDTGPGIPESEIPNIWNRLYRGEMSRTARGMGLGLSIVRAFAKAIGGTIAVHSKLGEGTCFTVTLPAPRLPE